MDKTQLFSFFLMSLLSHSFHVSPNIRGAPDRLVGTFPISVTSMAHQIFSWLRVFTRRQFITKSKALSLKGTLQQTNYQVMSPTEKLKFCELQPRSAVCFECSNRNYSLHWPSLSLFHYFSFLSPLKSPTNPNQKRKLIMSKAAATSKGITWKELVSFFSYFQACSKRPVVY